ncbi:Ca2+-binding RTX toxin-like protein [Duganella sp. 1411]|uniref:beta strand repeat-containing protein n=1 Tax=Duganella sp. 1411 TaxID=2806572 RepID=UPI001AE98D21|nr:calcium-binding protein [Duganella sp. 1411]MBP1208054.1 Ca2+-binding RTX toxin-like protein [Duganella sp. 1411]
MATFTGTTGNDSLAGSTTADQMFGLEGNDTLLGNAGNDVLDGGAGADALNGGLGVDIATYANSAAAVTVNLTTGAAFGGDAQGDTLVAIETVIGSAYNDSLSSSTAGHTLAGGAGDDLYTVGIATVVVLETAGNGYDEVQTGLAALSIAGYDNVEKLTYTGSAAFTGTGNAGDNLITGGIGNDALTGGAGNDELIGGVGNDTLAGGVGADVLRGGAGIDTASYADAVGVAVTINLKTGIHTGIAAGDVFDSIEVIRGTSYSDTFTGDADPNSFDGGAAGFDGVDYSTSAAAVNVNLSTNVLSGGDAQGDSLVSIELVTGSAYNDTLASSNAAHTLRGGAGDDLYIVGAAGVVLGEAAGNGNDEVQTGLAALSIENYDYIEKLTYTGTGAFTGTGSVANNIITGGIGNDMLTGGAGNDELIGGLGNDTLAGGVGDDLLRGGAGIDTASYADAVGAAVTINLKTGIHTGIAAGDIFDNIEVMRGTSYSDTFTGDANPNSFDGGAAGFDGVDYSTSAAAVNVNLSTNVLSGGDAEGDSLVSIELVTGSAFNDTLASSNATHMLRGGAGDDIYVLGVAGVVVAEAAGNGNDEVRTALATLSIATYDNVEKLTYTGTAAFTGTGNAGDNIITGGLGNDTLYGGAGADEFHGGAGTDVAGYADAAAGVTINVKTGIHGGIAAGDTYDSIELIRGSNFADTFTGKAGADSFDGGAGADTIDYSTSAAAVTVNLTTNAVSGGDAQGDVLLGFEAVNGSAFDDTLSSSTAGHVLRGGAGNDLYIVNLATVVVAETAGNGYDEVQTAIAALSIAGYGSVEKLTYIGTGAFTGTGNAIDNIITGGGGNDTLYGGAGADEFHGGAGTDAVGYADATAAVTVNLKTGVHTGIAAGDTYDNIEVIRGSNFADTFAGNADANTFDGGAGVDTIDYSSSTAAVNVNLTTNVVAGGDAQGDILTAMEAVTGSAFNDTLASSTAGHTLAGGAGNDLYTVGIASVVVAEAAGNGIDEVQTGLAALSIAAYANVEKLTYLGTASFTGTGNAGDNVLTGGSGNDNLLGGAGADEFFGGAGIDTVSYTDGNAMTLNFATGDFSGIGHGDSFHDIEKFAGSNFGDIFIESGDSHQLDGQSGVDMVSYETATSAITFDLAAKIQTGIAAGDLLTNIEVIQATGFADTLVGDGNANIFIGGAGADAITGGLGNDTSWYLHSVAGVQIDLAAGTAAGGDAAGDALTSVENLIGSSLNDTITGNTAVNVLEGGYGDDIIYGGDGADTIFGDVGSSVLPLIAANSGAQADMLYGGNGNDTITTAANDVGSIAFGEAGVDTITVVNGIADGGIGNDFLTVRSGQALGGEGDDRIAVNGQGVARGGDGDDGITGYGSLYSLYGDAGADTLNLDGVGDAFGGEGGDTYYVKSSGIVHIRDTGTTGTDYVYLNNIATFNDLFQEQRGDDLYLTSQADMNDNGVGNSGVLLLGWFTGGNTVEFIVTADGGIHPGT